MTTPAVGEAWLDQIFDRVEADMLACGWFERVGLSEPKNAPGGGLSGAAWLQSGPDPLGHISGLKKASALLVFNVRVYHPMISSSPDMIDPNATKAVAALMRRWHDDYDFDLPDIVRNVDLFGHSGVRLSSRAGYVEQSGTMYRVMTITLPIIVNDVYPIGSSS